MAARLIKMAAAPGRRPGRRGRGRLSGTNDLIERHLIPTSPSRVGPGRLETKQSPGRSRTSREKNCEMFEAGKNPAAVACGRRVPGRRRREPDGYLAVQPRTGNRRGPSPGLFQGRFKHVGAPLFGRRRWQLVCPGDPGARGSCGRRNLVAWPELEPTGALTWLSESPKAISSRWQVRTPETIKRLGTVDEPPAIRSAGTGRRDPDGSRRLKGSFATLGELHRRIESESSMTRAFFCSRPRSLWMQRRGRNARHVAYRQGRRREVGPLQEDAMGRSQRRGKKKKKLGKV